MSAWVCLLNHNVCFHTPKFNLVSSTLFTISFCFFSPCKWYEWWEKSGFFVADPESKKPPFVIVRFCSITSEWGLFFFEFMEFQDYQDLVNFRVYKSGLKAFIYWLWFMNRLCHHRMWQEHFTLVMLSLVQLRFKLYPSNLQLIVIWCPWWMMTKIFVSFFFLLNHKLPLAGYAS